MKLRKNWYYCFLITSLVLPLWAQNPEPKQTENPEPKQTENPQPTQTENPQPKKTQKPQPKKTENPQPKKTQKPQPKQTENPQPKKTQKPQPKQTENPQPKKTEKPQPSQNSPTTTQKEPINRYSFLSLYIESLFFYENQNSEKAISYTPQIGFLSIPLPTNDSTRINNKLMLPFNLRGSLILFDNNFFITELDFGEEVYNLRIRESKKDKYFDIQDVEVMKSSLKYRYMTNPKRSNTGFSFYPELGITYKVFSLAKPIKRYKIPAKDQPWFSLENQELSLNALLSFGYRISFGNVVNIAINSGFGYIHHLTEPQGYFDYSHLLLNPNLQISIPFDFLVKNLSLNFTSNYMVKTRLSNREIKGKSQLTQLTNNLTLGAVKRQDLFDLFNSAYNFEIGIGYLIPFYF